MASFDREAQNIYVPNRPTQEKNKTSPIVWVGIGCMGLIIIFVIVCAVSGKKFMSFAKDALATEMANEIRSAYTEYADYSSDSEDFADEKLRVDRELKKFELLVDQKKITFADLVTLSDRYEQATYDNNVDLQEARELMKDIRVLIDKYWSD